MSRKTIFDLQQKIDKKQKIVMVAAYTANMAKIADDEVDIILVGDSLGMVIYGFESTLPVTIDMMINHGKAVVKNSKQAFVVVDMPFASYGESKEQAFRNAALLLQQTGASAVKLEAGSELQDTVKYLVERGIPVMGHIGLLPQHVNKLGGYKIQGKDDISREKINNDAIALEQAGVFALTIEGVKQEIVSDIKNNVKLPLIGIGASKQCDGQVLVINDLLGMSDSKAKFIKQYANINLDIKNALQKYSEEVRNEVFPDDKYCY